MKLCVIGTGYVGLVSGACLADAGNLVVCVDNNSAKVEALNSGRIPIFEPGLEEVIRRNESERRLSFTEDLATALSNAEVVFITVNTPPDGAGRADISNVLAVAEKIGQLLDHPAVVVTKSTVPVGTTAKVKAVVSKGLRARGFDPAAILDVASNPEFLKEGSAVEDFMRPDRVIVGVEKEAVAKKLHALYAPFMLRDDRFIAMNIASAELTKYAANAMLATRISFMNELARLSEKVGADIGSMKRGLGSDPRIGKDFLYAGLGFGGSCFPKDTSAVIELGREFGAPLSIVESARLANLAQREWFWQKIAQHFGGEAGIGGKKFGVWGVAFKANTDDCREAPALYLIEKLLEHNASVYAFDPAGVENAKEMLGTRSKDVMWADGAHEALEGADALIVCTEWREFRSPDFTKMKSLMRKPVIFDGRNLYNQDTMRLLGFSYTGVGRGTEYE